MRDILVLMDLNFRLVMVTNMMLKTFSLGLIDFYHFRGSKCLDQTLDIVVTISP